MKKVFNSPYSSFFFSLFDNFYGNPSGFGNLTGFTQITKKIKKRFFFLFPEKYIFCFLLGISVCPAWAQDTKDLVSREIKTVTVKVNDKDKPKNNEWTKTTYDKKGNVLSEIQYNDAEEITKWQKFSYNSHDKITEEQKLDKSGNIEKTTYTSYNAQNQKKEEVAKDASGTVLSTIFYDYDGFGLRTSETKTDGKGNKKEKSVYEYDNKGMLVSKKIYNEKDELIYTKVLIYEY